MQEFLIGLENGYDLRPFASGEDDLSSCPCFSIDSIDFKAEGRCWRTSYHFTNGDSCDHYGSCCVHVWGDAESGTRIKELLDIMDWYGEWNLVVEADKPLANF